MKKGKFLFAVLSAILFVSLISGAYAQGIGNTTRNILDGFAKEASPVLSWFLGDVNITVVNATGSVVSTASPGDVLFVKLLLFIMMLAVSLALMSKIEIFKDKAFVSWVLSLAFAVLGTRFLASAQVINFVWFPTGVVGVTLTVIIPIIIFFLFIESFENAIIRKIGWSFFAVIFFIITLMKWNDLSCIAPNVAQGITGTICQAMGTTTGVQWWMNLGWIYILGALLSVTAIVFDRSIRARYFASVLIGTLDTAKQIQAEGILVELNRLNSQLQYATTQKQRDALKTEIDNKRKALGAL